jgi:hypothetical protein
MHLLKVAMLTAASKHDEPMITKEDLERALALLGHIEPAMTKTFAAVGKNPLTLDIVKAGQAVLTQPGIDYGALLRMLSHSVRKEELDEVLTTLGMMGHIRVVQETSGPKYYPTDFLEQKK